MARERTNVTISRARKRKFLDMLAKTGKVNFSAQAVGLKDSRVMRAHRQNDEEFAKEWELALDAAADNLEDEALRRATEGVLDPVFYRGKLVGYRINYSDTLLIKMLEAMRPKKFGRRLNVDGEINHLGVAAIPMPILNADEWQAQALRLTANQEQSKKVLGLTPSSETETEEKGVIIRG